MSGNHTSPVHCDRTPVVVRSATVTALSKNLDGLWEKLLCGKTAMAPITRFKTDHYTSSVGACIEDLPAGGPASMIHELISRLFKNWGTMLADTFILTASTKSGIDNLEKTLRGDPAETRDILLPSLPDIVSEKSGLAGGGINISAACASATVAIARAAAMIASGRREVVLVCCLDLLTEFIYSGFSALRALSPTPPRPFDRGRDGLSPGEGAAALLLMSRARAEKEKISSLGSIAGWGIANDATHITAPARNGCGLIQAVRGALEMSGIGAEGISAVSAHGTGTVYNDAMEITAFREVFGKRNLPVFSVKGAIGHILGAAGGIEVVLGLKTLSEQTAPPTVGLSTPMEGAEGMVSGEPVAFSGNRLLTTNSGFGGINAALILESG